MKNINNQKMLGMALSIIGIIAFVIAMGDLILRVVGGILAIALINHGLKIQGLPNIFVYIMSLFNFKR